MLRQHLAHSPADKPSCKGYQKGLGIDVGSIQKSYVNLVAQFSFLLEPHLQISGPKTLLPIYPVEDGHGEQPSSTGRTCHLSKNPSVNLYLLSPSQATTGVGSLSDDSKLVRQS